MSVQIVIVGLGKIGASIGLALAKHTDQVTRIGHDREPGIARRAQQRGAVDRVALNLPSAVRDAHVVILALPLHEVRSTLQVIADDLREDVVVFDTSPAKRATLDWAQQILPPKRHFIGLTPMLNPAYLHDPACGLEAAHADLFQGGMMGIVTPRGTVDAAIELAVNLTRLLGATPFFLDVDEVDGLMAGLHLLPQVMAAALVHATVDQAGWAEGRKLAGVPFALATQSMEAAESELALREAALLNREALLRGLDRLLSALNAFRQHLEVADADALHAWLERAAQGRSRWWAARQRGAWEDAAPEPRFPSAREVFGRLLGLGREHRKT